MGEDDLSGGDDNVQIVFAVYGGKDDFWNVTDKVGELLKDLPDGFFAHPDVLLLPDAPSDSSLSLIILYNYNAHRHFYVRENSGPKISLGVLREAAKIDDSTAREVTLSPDSKPEDAPTVVFATFGVHATFWDVTDKVKRLLLDSPTGFFPHEDVMGGDPEWGSGKNIVIVTDYNGGFHFFAETNGGAKISMKILASANKNDGVVAKSGP